VACARPCSGRSGPSLLLCAERRRVATLEGQLAVPRCSFCSTAAILPGRPLAYRLRALTGRQVPSGSERDTGAVCIHQQRPTPAIKCGPWGKSSTSESGDRLSPPSPRPRGSGLRLNTFPATATPAAIAHRSCPFSPHRPSGLSPESLPLPPSDRRRGVASVMTPTCKLPAT